MICRKESFYFKQMYCAFLTQMTRGYFGRYQLSVHGPFFLWVSQCACAWHTWKRQRSQVPRRAGLRAALCFPRKALGFACMDKLPRGTSCVRVGSLHGSAALWRDRGKVSECFLKSCGCLSVVSGPGSAFELGVKSRLFLCSSVYIQRFCSRQSN